VKVLVLSFNVIFLAVTGSFCRKAKIMNASVEKAFTNFKQHFQPAYSVIDADEYFSTKEVYDRIIDITGDMDLTYVEVYTILEQSGFTYDYVMGEFKWLLKCINF